MFGFIGVAFVVLFLSAHLIKVTAQTQTALVSVGDTWKYLKGTANPDAAWKNVSFDDSSWLSGPTGIGYGDGDDATLLTDMEDNYLTVYSRKTFSLASTNTTTLTLTIDFDDCFVAYLNGQEVARRKMPVSPLPQRECGQS